MLQIAKRIEKYSVPVRMIPEDVLSGVEDCAFYCNTVNVNEYPLKDMCRISAGNEIEDMTIRCFKHWLNKTKFLCLSHLNIFYYCCTRMIGLQNAARVLSDFQETFDAKVSCLRQSFVSPSHINLNVCKQF